MAGDPACLRRTGSRGPGRVAELGRPGGGFRRSPAEVGGHQTRFAAGCHGFKAAGWPGW